jgi:ribosomal protein L40E
MLRTVTVSRDYEGQKLAAIEMFKESLVNTQRRQTGPARSMADGYYTRVEYLFWLRSRLALTTMPLRADELEGLAALAEAQAIFERDHPQCGRCHARNWKFAMKCRNCPQDFSPRKK